MWKGKQREGKRVGPREKLGYDTVTTKASANLIECSEAGLHVEVVPSWGEIDRPLFPQKPIHGYRLPQ